MRVPHLVLAAFVLFAVGCDDPADPEPTATLRVTASSSGAAADLDPNGYTVSIDSRFPDRINANGTLTLADLTPGEHVVSVGDTESNCTLTSENHRTVTLEAGQTVTVGFSFACVPRRGSIHVAVTTTGQDVDANGYGIAVWTQDYYVPVLLFSARVDANAELTLEDIPAGILDVELSDLAENCTVTSQNPRGVNVAHLATVSVGFDVACTAPFDLHVSVATTGTDLDPDGYTVTAPVGDERRAVATPVNGEVTLQDLMPAVYTVSLLGASLNCDVAGENPRTIDATAGGTVATEFDVACIARETLAFVSSADGDAEIYLALDDGTELTRLTDNAAEDRDPAWSPDGQQIVFSSDRDGNEEIYVMAADGTGVTRLTTDPAPDRQPAWSPDGATILFVSERDGNAELYTMATDGTGVARLTQDQAPDVEPAWSPDGEHIAFVRGDLLHVMDADGTGARAVTSYESYYYRPVESDPDWSPDGSRIAFAAYWCDDYYGTGCSPNEIGVVNTDGTGLTYLLATAGEELEPAWYPDGRKIAFAVDDCTFGYPGQCTGGIRAVRLGVEVVGVIDVPSGSPAWRP